MTCLAMVEKADFKTATLEAGQCTTAGTARTLEFGVAQYDLSMEEHLTEDE